MVSGCESTLEESTRKQWSPLSSLLPPADSPLVSAGSLHMGSLIKARKQEHTFLSFADAICYHQHDHAQGWLVARTYAFLHDFMPRGFSGQWSHICGQRVMEILLCHTRSLTAARHIVAQNACAIFAYLEEWMNRGASWRAAAANAEYENTVYKKGSVKAPTLCTPEGLVALLILSYPETTKYLQRIDSLQIGWMMGPHDDIMVKDGFWKGITKDDLVIFEPSKTRHAKVPLLADYTKLLGEDFLRAQNDHQSFPEWTQHRVRAQRKQSSDVEASVGDRGCSPSQPPSVEQEDLTENLCIQGSDVEIPAPEEPDDVVGNASGPAQPLAVTEVASEPLDLARHLHPDTTKISEQDLQTWLSQKLASCSHGDILFFWCEHWAKRMDDACWYEEQAILRSLFLRSLRTVHSLCSVVPEYTTMANAFMLLDVEDGRARQVPTDSKSVNGIGRLGGLPLYAPFMKAKAQITRIAQDHGRRVHLDALFHEQMGFFYELSTKGPFKVHLEDVVKFDIMRTNRLIQKATDRGPSPSEANGIAASPARLADEADEEMVKTLKLTKWQVRALVVCSDGILTDSQLRIRDLGSRGMLTIPRHAPVRAEPMQDYGPDANLDTQETLRKLFGNIHTWYAASHGHVLVPDSSHEDAPIGRPAGSPEQLPRPTGLVQPTSHRSVFSGFGPTEEKHRPSASSSTGEAWTPFASVSAKRPHSPDLRNVKVPRLAEPTMQDVVDQLRSDMAASNERLRDELELAVIEELSRRMGKAGEQTEAATQSKLAAIEARVVQVGQQTEAKIQSIANAMEVQLWSSGQQTKKEIQALVDTLEVRFAADIDKAGAKVQALKDTVDTLQQTWAVREHRRRCYGV